MGAPEKNVEHDGVHDEDDHLDPELKRAREDEEIVFMRGPSGVIWPMGLPLSEPIAEQAAKGELTRVNEDGSFYEPTEHDPELSPELPRDRLEREHRAAVEYARLKQERPDEDPIVLRDEAADLHDDPISEDAPHPGDHVDGVHPDDHGKPKPAAPKAEWVDFAVEHGADRDDAESMTKAQLVEKFS